MVWIYNYYEILLADKPDFIRCINKLCRITTTMKKYLITFLLTILIKFSVSGQCSCYTVQGLNIVGIDSMELILSNTCDNNVYLNLYVISALHPFDTLGRQEKWNAAISPKNTNVSNVLNTNLTSPPTFGTYRVSITNRNLVCDSLRFSSTMSITDIQPNGSVIIYPNPFSTQTTLWTENSVYNAILTVTNSQGQTVVQIKNISGQTIVFNRDNLASGVYVSS